MAVNVFNECLIMHVALSLVLILAISASECLVFIISGCVIVEGHVSGLWSQMVGAGGFQYSPSSDSE